MIQAQGLVKRFGDVTAVDGVSLDVARGEAFGLLGPNGAGKTTTIGMLVGALAPDTGQIAVAGLEDPTRPEVKRRIGVAPQELALYDVLTGEENLAFFGRLYGLRGARLRERVQWGLEFAELTERRRSAISTYSGGMKRRLNLACALVHEPDVFFLDEPTVGVDPQSRNHIFERIESLRTSGCTLIYTTHYMEEAQRLCDRVAIIDRGSILAVDTVERLIRTHGGDAVVEATFAGAAPAGLPDGAEVDGRTVRVQTAAPFDVATRLGALDATVESLQVRNPDLERVFLNLTGRRLRD